MADLDAQLHAARQNLLDLTLRNRLLNFRPTVARTLRVVDEIPREVYDLLVIQERTLSFRALPAATGDEPPELPPGLTAQEAATLWMPPLPDAPPEFPPGLAAPEGAVAPRHTDRFLQTLLDSAALQKRLFTLYQQAHSFIEEQGTTVLYLALGFLEWTEPGSPQPRRAPLVLVPVDLSRTRAGAAFRLVWTGEDLMTNISLQAKLAEQGIRLPDFEMPEEKGGLDAYFQAVARAAAARPGWAVQSDLYLDFFSFTKFLMYRDLDPRAWPEGRSPVDHPLVRTLLAPAGPPPEGDGFREEEVDAKLTARAVYHILDADPSQIAVIEDAKAGRNLVVEGPPGTGKSQTIANLIAELLAAGRSVLFVSEKMAALEVVKARLDRAGLGDFCLELHSRKSSKRAVLRELERVLGAPPPAPPPSADEYDRIEALKTDLNGYARALREPVGTLGRSAHALYGMKERARHHFDRAGRPMPRIEFPDAERCEPAAYAAAESKLAALAQVLPLVAPVPDHPWRGCVPGTILPADIEELREQIAACKVAAGRLDAALGRLVELAGVASPAALDALNRVLAAAKLVAASEPNDPAILLGTAWDRPNPRAEELIRQLEDLRSRFDDAKGVFEAEALDRDAPALLDDFRARSAGLFRFLSGRYRALKRELAALYRSRRLGSRAAVLADLDRLAEAVRRRRALREAEPEGRALFGDLWKGEAGEPHRLRTFAEWASAFRTYFRDGALAPAAARLVAAGVSRAAIEKAVADAALASREYIGQLHFIAYRVKADSQALFGAPPAQVPLAAWADRLGRWAPAVDRLPRWAQFADVRAAALKTAAAPLVPAIDDGRLAPEDLLPVFAGNVADSLLRRAFAARPALAGFIGDLHEDAIRRFAALDREVIQLNRRRLVHHLHARRPRLAGGASPQSEAGVLLGEFARKRGHMPIRKLMALAGGLVQRIKPCFLMSPLSIAQFLDPRTARFDVVLFDEASQVRPEDALGTLLRGAQVVIMGDTRQLPPTRFFDHLIEADGVVEEPEADAAAGVSDVESVLHQGRRAFPVKTLRWHYRSRHESLIAVSNRTFYDNRLLVYPSPFYRDDRLGLQLVHLADTAYDRGRSSINRREARAVAEAAADHARRCPDKSLGVGTFNVRQQEAILEEIELQLLAHPDLEPFFRADRDEPFFVKNLETIQGDERDVIFLSIGFGFDAARKLSLNFGPLNQAGGERRLNVLITRARERCVVFSNFLAADLDLPADAPAGLQALKAFLDYAESRDLPPLAAEPAPEACPIEESLAGALERQSLEVRRHVGCGGFRVDLAAVDPMEPGRYLVGIECDGAKYHESPVARERDRLRQQVLEALGWRLLRVWSTEWYRNREEAETRLLKDVEAALRDRERALDEAADSVSVRGEVAAAAGPAGVPVVASASTGAPPAAAPARKPAAADRTAPAAGPREPEAAKTPAPARGPAEEPSGEAPLYVPCPDLGFPAWGELHEQPPALLVRALQRVVDVEGPVHVDEAIRRVRQLWKLKRTGERVYAALSAAIPAGVQKGAFRRRGDFLWPAADRPAPARRREEDPPARIELICDEEIAAAIREVVRLQFATAPRDLAARAARLLGFHAAFEAVAARIGGVIEGMAARGELQRLPNGMVDVPR